MGFFRRQIRGLERSSGVWGRFHGSIFLHLLTGTACRDSENSERSRGGTHRPGHLANRKFAARLGFRAKLYGHKEATRNAGAGATAPFLVRRWGPTDMPLLLLPFVFAEAVVFVSPN